MSLEKFLDQFEDYTSTDCVIDLSEFCNPPAESGKEVLRFKEPDICQGYWVMEEIATWKKSFPDWSNTQLYYLVMLTRCHVEPKPANGESIGRFYARMASAKNPRMFLKVIAGFLDQFPIAVEMAGGSDKEQKKIADSLFDSASDTSTDIPAS